MCLVMVAVALKAEQSEQYAEDAGTLRWGGGLGRLRRMVHRWCWQMRWWVLVVFDDGVGLGVGVGAGCGAGVGTGMVLRMVASRTAGWGACCLSSVAVMVAWSVVALCAREKQRRARRKSKTAVTGLVDVSAEEGSEWRKVVSSGRVESKRGAWRRRRKMGKVESFSLRVERAVFLEVLKALERGWWMYRLRRWWISWGRSPVKM